MTFQECLNSYIKELGCSGKELAANSGISETVISRYRKGERLPASDSEYLKKLADGIVKTAIEKGRPDWESESVLQKLKETLAGEGEEIFYYQKFDLLIKELEINGSKMAAALHYDPSYISKIRAGKRRPTRMGEMPMFSGLLYCADCGSKLTFHRKADEPAEKHHYICGNYRSNTSNCTMHYIRNVVVERIVLENLKEVIHYVSNYEDEFVRMVMDADVRQKNRELAQKKKKLIELQKRIGELDTIFQRIYEDNITGKLSDERFMKMSKGYEDEQHTLQAEADKIQNELQQEEKKSVDVKRFLAIVKKYTDLTELTPEILREFVDKIIVHAPDKSSGRRLQEIEIIYNHIGEFDHSKVTLWKGNAV